MAGSQANYMKQVEETLKGIFYFYAEPTTALKARYVKSIKFQKMAADACILDDVLSPAKLDLVIKKVVGQRSRMELEEFLDAMVLLASTKYGTVQQNHPQRSRGTGSGSAQPQQQPAPDPCSALVRLYEQHLSTFCATPLVALNADDPPQFIRVVLAALGGLYRLYLSYFSLEVNSHYQSPFAEIESEGLKGFAKFCTDFEIIPFLVSKPHVYACFREAVARPVAEEVSKAVHVPLPGRNFTFLRFVFALLGVAERVFPRDCDTTAFVRLIERMEASKGSVAASMSSSGFPLSEAPAVHVQGLSQPAHGKLLPAELVAEHLNATPYPPQILKSSPAMPNFSPPSVAGGAQERQTGGNAAQNKKPEECERAELAEENLPWKSIESSLSKQDRTLMHQVFCYYSSQADPLNRQWLSSLKFNRFLRDTGLLSQEGFGAVTFKFECGPPGPHAPLSMSGGYLSSVRAVPVAPGRSEKADPVEFTLSPCKPRSVAARPHTVQPERLTAPESGREKDAAAPVSERTAEDEELMMLPFSHKCALPLRVLDRPALSQVDADLIFIQMTTVKVHPKDTPTGASNGPGVFPRNPGFIRGKGPVSYSVDKSRPASSAVSCSAPGARQTGGPSSRRSKRHHMNFDAFVKACCEVAARVTDEASPVSALQAFVGRFLVPLSESLLEVRGHDVAAAAMLMADEGAVEILNRCQWGLERIFSHYAHFVSKERPVMHRLRGASARQPKTMMSLQAFNQFCTDFELAADLSSLHIQRVFYDCVHVVESANSAEPSEHPDMCYLSFQLAVVLLAIKLFAAPPSPDAAHHSTARAGQGLVKPSDVQKLTMLLHRLNSTSAAGRLVGSAFNEAFGAMVVALGKKDAASRKVCLLAVPQMSSFVQKAAEAGLGGCGNLSNLHKTPRAVRVERTPVTSWKSVRQALNHVQAETLDRGMQGPPPQGGEGLVTEGGDAGGPDVHTFVGGSGEGGTVQKGLEGEVHEGPGMSNGLQHHGKLAGETRE